MGADIQHVEPVLVYPQEELGTILRAMIARLDAGDMEGALDVFDKRFLAAWHSYLMELRPSERCKLLKDVRGCIVGMYALMREREGLSEDQSSRS